MKLLTTSILLLVLTVAAFSQNEQAPILERDIEYKDWTLKGIRDGRELNLRQLIAGKKLVAVVYFAPWCGNWRFDAPMLERLYQKYRSAGFEIVAVGQYDPVYVMKDNLEQLKVTFPAVYESDSRDAKQKTRHYEYRRSVGDTRNWGSPWYIFLEPEKLEKKGDVLLRRANVINGEMIETEGEAFIRRKLGLEAEPAKALLGKNREPEACSPSTSSIGLIRP